MKYTIPSSTKRILQDNKNQYNGNIAESFNLDLTSEVGKIGVTKTKKVADFESTTANTTQPITNINQKNGLLFFFGADIGDCIFEGGSSAFSSTFIRDTSSVNGFSGSDLVISNGFAYATESTKVVYSEISVGTWTDIASPTLDADTPHLLTSLGSEKYVTNLDYKIGHISSSNVLTLSGDNTIDFGLSGYTITVLMAGLDRIWVGFSALQDGQYGTTYIYEWDGASNIPSQRYEIDASGLICGVIKDGTPYVLDTNGRLLAYSGATFQEIARLPYKQGELMAGFNTNQFNNRAIHPRAVTTDQDEILFNISNRLQGGGWADFPSGVWAYSQENGLYHKYSATNQPTASTGTTNLEDYGQMRVAQAGGIFVHDAQVSLSDSGEGGRVLFSQRYFTGSDDSTATPAVDETYKTAIFTDDTKDNTQKFGYFITRELTTESVVDTWQKIYTKHRRLLDSADKIFVRYTTDEQKKVISDITWVDIDRFTSTEDLSDFKQGDEVQIVQGYMSGKSITIKSITENAGTYTIIIKDTVPTSCYGRTSVAHITNFRYIGEVSQNQLRYSEHTTPVDNVSPIMYVKVCMQFTGNNKLYELQAISKESIK